MKTKAILFDKDGTLLDFAAFWVTVSEYAVKDIKVRTCMSEVPDGELLASLGVENGISRIDGILTQFPYPVMGKAIYDVLYKYGCKYILEEIIEITTKCYYDNMQMGIVKPDCENAFESLEALKKKGIKLIVVTNDNYDTTVDGLDKVGLLSCFDAIYTIDNGFPPKPNPHIIDFICEKYSLDRAEVIMVGDTLADMDFAINGRIKGIGVAKNANNKKLLSAKTDIVIENISYLFDVTE